MFKRVPICSKASLPTIHKTLNSAGRYTAPARLDHVTRWHAPCDAEDAPCDRLRESDETLVSSPLCGSDGNSYANPLAFMCAISAQASEYRHTDSEPDSFPSKKASIPPPPTQFQKRSPERNISIPQKDLGDSFRGQRSGGFIGIGHAKSIHGIQDRKKEPSAILVLSVILASILDSGFPITMSRRRLTRFQAMGLSYVPFGGLYRNWRIGAFFKGEKKEISREKNIFEGQREIQDCGNCGRGYLMINKVVLCWQHWRRNTRAPVCHRQDFMNQLSGGGHPVCALLRKYHQSHRVPALGRLERINSQRLGAVSSWNPPDRRSAEDGREVGRWAGARSQSAAIGHGDILQSDPPVAVKGKGGRREEAALLSWPVFRTGWLVFHASYYTERAAGYPRPWAIFHDTHLKPAQSEDDVSLARASPAPGPTTPPSARAIVAPAIRHHFLQAIFPSVKQASHGDRLYLPFRARCALHTNLCKGFSCKFGTHLELCETCFNKSCFSYIEMQRENLAFVVSSECIRQESSIQKQIRKLFSRADEITPFVVRWLVAIMQEAGIFSSGFEASVVATAFASHQGETDSIPGDIILQITGIVPDDATDCCHSEDTAELPEHCLGIDGSRHKKKWIITSEGQNGHQDVIPSRAITLVTKYLRACRRLGKESEWHLGRKQNIPDITTTTMECPKSGFIAREIRHSHHSIYVTPPPSFNSPARQSHLHGSDARSPQFTPACHSHRHIAIFVRLALKIQRHDGNTACLGRSSYEELGVRVTVTPIAPLLLDLGCAATYKAENDDGDNDQNILETITPEIPPAKGRASTSFDRLFAAAVASTCSGAPLRTSRVTRYDLDVLSPARSSGARGATQTNNTTSVKAVHDNVSTFEISLRKTSLHLPAYILIDALGDVHPVKLPIPFANMRARVELGGELRRSRHYSHHSRIAAGEIHLRIVCFALSTPPYRHNSLCGVRRDIRGNAILISQIRVARARRRARQITSARIVATNLAEGKNAPAGLSDVGFVVPMLAIGFLCRPPLVRAATPCQSAVTHPPPSSTFWTRTTDFLYARNVAGDLLMGPLTSRSKCVAACWEVTKIFHLRPIASRIVAMRYLMCVPVSPVAFARSFAMSRQVGGPLNYSGLSRLESRIKARLHGATTSIDMCFTAFGVGPLVFVRGSMNTEAYCNILDNEMLPKLWHFYGMDPCYFQDYNASPNLSPIEHLWDELDRRVRARQERPKSIAQLMEWLQEKWRRIPVDVLQTLVESMPDMVAAVIAAKGLCSKAVVDKLLPADSWRFLARSEVVRKTSEP
ncbi:hypothetical protein PR048_006729 [Dryococelus australis]|uniref:Transposase n=1 Tax=Dryococelus australis TaxID=614101 RepID=A0ABQ9IBS1_9NEOP|nr:hypothetical protein PR048_006729 [Dryococelus australis]